MKNNISQTVYFSATPHQVFEAFLDEKKHADFTEANAKIDRKVGGKFSVWDGYASGSNKVLVKDKKIVQSWRASDWPENVESEITLELYPEKNKTKLIFTQTGVPKNFVEDVKSGWQDYYWLPLEKFLINNEKV
jgi:activator of HSP90 ATPase